MTFGKAMDSVREDPANKSMRLPHWKPDVKIKIQVPDEYSKMTAPYFYVESRYGCVPWIPNMIELMGDEWEIGE